MSGDLNLPASQWFYLENVEVYLRAGPNNLNGNRAKFVTVSNVEVKEKKRGTGVFSALLSEIEAEAIENGYQCIMIENVMEQRFADYFFKNGFVKRNELEMKLPFSVIKVL